MEKTSRIYKWRDRDHSLYSTGELFLGLREYASPVGYNVPQFRGLKALAPVRSGQR